MPTYETQTLVSWTRVGRKKKEVAWWYKDKI